MPRLEYNPDYAVHPSETVKEMIRHDDDNGMGFAHLDDMGKYEILCYLAEGEDGVITERLAEWINAACNLTVKMLLNLQNNYDTKKQQLAAEIIEEQEANNDN